jgi:striatin 1/3/4
MKFWNLEAALGDSRKPAGSELDPIHTYRGHTKGITAVALSADQNKCFSASLDRTVRAYGLVPMNKETYARLGMSSTTYLGVVTIIFFYFCQGQLIRNLPYVSYFR